MGGSDNIDGGSGNDSIFGNTDNDFIQGGTGNDTSTPAKITTLWLAEKATTF